MQACMSGTHGPATCLHGLQVSRNVYWIRAPDVPSYLSLRPWCAAHKATLLAEGLVVGAHEGRTTASFTIRNAHRAHVAFWVRLQVFRHPPGAGKAAPDGGDAR